MSRDPHQTSGTFQPIDVSRGRQDALTRAHSSRSAPRVSDRLDAGRRAASASSTSARMQSPARAASSGSTATSVPRASGRLPHTSSMRLPAEQFLGPSPSARMRQAKATRSRLTLGFVVGLILPVVAIVGIIWLMRPNPLTAQAALALREADHQLSLAREALSSRRVDSARQAVAAGKQSLAVPTPTDTQLVEQIKNVRQQLEQVETESVTVERDQTIETNHRQLMNQFTRVTILDAKGLDALESYARAFLANPVDPKGAPDAAAVSAASTTMMDGVRRQLDSIIKARQQLAAAETTDQVAKARAEVAGMVPGEHFQAALDRLADYQKRYPNGDFSDAKAFVENAARRSWEAAKVYVDSRVQDARSIGLPAAQRKQVIIEAKRRMNEVIERFGIPEYVDQAKALLAQIPD